MLVFLTSQVGLKWAIALELALAMSLFLHELGHCSVALRKGCRVREVTLYVIGGAAHMEHIPKKPRDELLMAIAGPAVSALLALIFWFLNNAFPIARINQLPGGPTFFACIFGLNLMLVLFNMLPAFPMDGGRVLRAALSNRLGRLRATAIAARLGMLFALLFVLQGLLSTTVFPLDENWGTNLRALMLCAIGFFVYTAADAEYTNVRMQEGDIGQADAMRFFHRQRQRILNVRSPDR